MPGKTVVRYRHHFINEILIAENFKKGWRKKSGTKVGKSGTKKTKVRKKKSKKIKSHKRGQKKAK